MTDLPATEISGFLNHPFKVRMDEEMEWLVDSVKKRGALSPVMLFGCLGKRQARRLRWK